MKIDVRDGTPVCNFLITSTTPAEQQLMQLFVRCWDEARLKMTAAEQKKQALWIDNHGNESFILGFRT